MNSIQYTIRGIPEPVDKALRELAKKKGRSFNQTVVDTLAAATGKTNEKAAYRDLDWFIGSADGCDKEFDEAMAWLDSMPTDIDDRER